VFSDGLGGQRTTPRVSGQTNLDRRYSYIEIAAKICKSARKKFDMTALYLQVDIKGT
jgi:hypothetical protein